MGRDELQEDHTIDGQISAKPEAQGGEQASETDKVRSGATSDTKDTGDAKRNVERGTTTDHVGQNPPRGGTKNQTDVEGKSHPTNVALDVEFTFDLGQDDGDTLKPKVIGHPTPTGEEEELPLEFAHADVFVHDLVEDVDFAFVDVINGEGVSAGSDLGGFGGELLLELGAVGRLDVVNGLFALDVFNFRAARHDGRLGRGECRIGSKGKGDS